MSNFQRTHHFSLSRTLLLHPEFLSSFQAVKNKTYKTTRSWDNSLEPHIDYIKCMYSFGTNRSVSILISNMEILANQSIIISCKRMESNLVGSVGRALDCKVTVCWLNTWDWTTNQALKILIRSCWLYAQHQWAVVVKLLALYPTPSQLKRKGAHKITHTDKKQ